MKSEREITMGVRAFLARTQDYINLTTQERNDVAALLEGIERSQSGNWLDGDRRLRIIAAYKELSALRTKGLTRMATWPSKSIQARIDLGPAGGSIICAECPIPKPPNPMAAVYAGFPRDCVRGVRDVWERETWDKSERPHLCPHFVGASRKVDEVVIGCSYPYSSVATWVLDREELVRLIGWTPDAPGSQGEGRSEP